VGEPALPQDTDDIKFITLLLAFWVRYKVILYTPDAGIFENPKVELVFTVSVKLLD
jgi:hypothetical protein